MCQFVAISFRAAGVFLLADSIAFYLFTSGVSMAQYTRRRTNVVILLMRERHVLFKPNDGILMFFSSVEGIVNERVEGYYLKLSIDGRSTA